MKVSKKRRIEIAKYVLETKGEDCIGTDADCCNCPIFSPCSDSDSERMVEYARLWMESEVGITEWRK